MTIAPFAAGLFRTQRSTEQLLSLKRQLDDANRQLTTGKVSDTYGGLGLERRTSLAAHGQIAALDGYDSTIETGQLRLKLQSQSVEQVSSSLTNTRNALISQAAQNKPLTRAAVQSGAQQNLSAALDALNQNVAGRYLFGGRVTDVAPVESVGVILNGDPKTGAQGLRAVIAERQAADLGNTAASPPEKGRLSLAGTGTAVTLSENASAASRANFGFALKGATSSGTGIQVNAGSVVPGVAGTFQPTFATNPQAGDVVRLAVVQADGSQKLVDFTARTGPTVGPNEFVIGGNAAASGASLKAAADATTAPSAATIASAQSATPPGLSLTQTAAGTAGQLQLDVAVQPADGDSVTITLGLRDGSQVTLTLTARANATNLDPTREFAIGGTTTLTADNLRTALGAALDKTAQGELAAASAVVAANDFFAGSNSTAFAPRRVSGSPATATGFVSAPAPGKTVIWYHGDEAPADQARSTAPLQVDRSEVVGTGAQANESAFRTALASLGALAADAIPSGTPGEDHYSALAGRVLDAINAQPDTETLQAVATSLSQASAALGQAQDRHKATRAILQNAVGSIEDASADKAATELVSLQTLLQASYQTTSMLSKLSLTNYL